VEQKYPTWQPDYRKNKVLDKELRISFSKC